MDITVATWKASRFSVRQGSQGWMVYDRQQKGPAIVGTKPAVDLTEEQANGMKLALMAVDDAALDELQTWRRPPDERERGVLQHSASIKDPHVARR
jgi:hypothetical protein